MLKKVPVLFVTVLAIIAIVSYFAYQKYLIAATVNGKPIGRLEIITELEKQGGKEILDKVITQKLIAEQAKKDNVSVSQADIDKELKEIEANIVSKGGTLDGALRQQGMTKDNLIQELKIQVTINKLVKTDKITVTDKEVDSYMKDNKDLFPADSEDEPDSKQIKDQLKQQKIQEKVQEYVTKLRSEAKIKYFGSYKD